MKMEPGQVQYKEWITKNMKSGDVVGCDGQQITISQFETTEKELEKEGIVLQACGNLVDEVWNKVGKTPMPTERAWHHEEKYSGESSPSKFERLAAELKDTHYLIVTTLDDIAWLLNLRGNDIQCNPLFFSYVLFDVQNKKVTLFVNDETVVDVR